MFYLKDYKAYPWNLKMVSLTFKLYDDYCEVHSYLRFQSKGEENTLVLNGEDLEMISAEVNGALLDCEQYTIDKDTLSIHALPNDVHLRTIVRIDPKRNKCFEGLYYSNSIYCTQCEAEGFRRITWFPDRPDVLSQFTVRIEADIERCPILLSNGNCIDQGSLDLQRHFATFVDPHPKPCYLFALVAGPLLTKADSFTTNEGREVTLKIHAERQHIDKCYFALESLKKSMRWDEERFGLSYDLDVFHIVAVDHFNSGAMENKGLNIFNAKLVFAQSDMASDIDYERIESVVAHEYFHNWTGNRVTCRDWFQLTLKEGLTVFRDQEFTADMRDGVCKRIEDVQLLMDLQFVEDAGALSHPIQPKEYAEINNFYTHTIYEKGAEVVRLYQTILGREGFNKGLRHYLKKHDGTGATVEEFRDAMGEANGVDLSMLKGWYDQAGTPTLKVRSKWSNDCLTIELQQHCQNNAILPIPFVYGVIDSKGCCLKDDEMIVFNEPHLEITVKDVPEGSVLSPLRRLSSPVRLEWDASDSDWLHLMQYDNDAYNRWFATRRNFQAAMLGKLDINTLVKAISILVAEQGIDPKLLSFLLQMPGIRSLLSEGGMDFLNLCKRTQEIIKEIGKELGDVLIERYTQLSTELTQPYSPAADQIGIRSLRNQLLRFIAIDQPDYASKQFETATNMTERLGALAAALLRPKKECRRRTGLLADFYEQAKGESLLIDRWFALSMLPPVETTVEVAEALFDHPDFNWNLPNRVRGLLVPFMQNMVAFHREDGKGYALVSESLIRVDSENAQLAARIFTGFDGVQHLPEGNKLKARAQLERVLNSNCSINSKEQIEKIISRL